MIDFKIKWFVKKRSIGADEILLIDRFNLDTLADLMVDTNRLNLHRTWVGRQFIKIVPDYSNVFILEVRESSIRARKKDTLYDETLGRKLEVYNILSRDLGLKSIDNNGKIDDAYNEILNYINYGKSQG